MNKMYLGIAIISLLFLVGCTVDKIDTTQVSSTEIDRITDAIIECPDDYMRFATGCCLDFNKNKICDVDENKIPIQEVGVI